MHPSPWYSQPDPEKPFFVPATAKKLVRRGPRDYFMVGAAPDGGEVELRLSAGVFTMEGIERPLGTPIRPHDSAAFAEAHSFFEERGFQLHAYEADGRW